MVVVPAITEEKGGNASTRCDCPPRKDDAKATPASRSSHSSRQQRTFLAAATMMRMMLLTSHIPSSEAWFAATKPKARPKAVPNHIRLLILPGFFNDSADYDLMLPKNNNHRKKSSATPTTTTVDAGPLTPPTVQGDDVDDDASVGSLVQSLYRRGWSSDQVQILPVRRTDWLQVFGRGALDIDFWKGCAAPTNPAFSWYLTRVQTAIAELTARKDLEDQNEENTKVVLLCHSAGGWLARAAIANADDDDLVLPSDAVAGLVTLGAPHDPPPPTVMDMTRGALQWTSDNYPGAFFRDDLFYLTVVGESVQGVVPSPNNKKWPWEPTSPPEFAYNSYEAVCGDGTVVGDGVVPLCAAHLDGAQQQLTLPGVYHSINVPAQWYGSDTVIDTWHDAMVNCIQQQQQTTKQKQKNLLDNLFS